MNVTDMRRPLWITGLVALQLLLGLLFTGLCIYLLFLIRSPQMKHEPYAAESTPGLKMAAGIIAPMGLLLLVAAYGMWKLSRWGWWFALITDLLLASIGLYSVIDDGLRNPDPEMIATTVVPVALIILMLSPPVRRIFLGTKASSVPSAVL